MYPDDDVLYIVLLIILFKHSITYIYNLYIVIVKTEGGIFKRRIKRISPLPIDVQLYYNFVQAGGMS